MTTHDKAYLEEGEGPAVLLIHGFPLGAWMWNPQIDALVPYCRVLAPELRGFGAARLPSPSCRIDDYAADMVKLLGERGIERAAVIGCSMGGYIALAMAERFPERISALVLVATKATADTMEEQADRSSMMDRARREGPKWVASKMVPKLFSPATAQARPDLPTIVKENIHRVAPSAIVCAIGAMRDRPDRRGALGKLRVPILLARGADDAISTEADLQAMQAANPTARTVVIPGAGHLANLEQPEAFNAALLPFLEQALRSEAPAPPRPKPAALPGPAPAAISAAIPPELLALMGGAPPPPPPPLPPA
jgi:3-oxoadipate enol-lactonase